MDDADPRGLEQGGHGRVPRLGADQRPGSPADVGQEAGVTRA